jgi:Uma2 family endonuclease
MGNEEEKNLVKEPYSEYGSYTYADYLTWEIDHMVELIKGKVFQQATAAPRRIHQEISGRLFFKLYLHLEKKNCKVFSAPFDVRLPVKSKKHEDITTVVQPDICVVCDPEKLDDLGCVGAPDLIMEILSLLPTIKKSSRISMRSMRKAVSGNIGLSTLMKKLCWFMP